MRSRSILLGTTFGVLVIIGLVFGPSQVLAAKPAPVEAVAEITTPAGGQYLGDLTEVEGSANCSKFAYWTLSYKATEDTVWTELTQSSTPADNEPLFSWDTSGLAEGWYELRLAVYSTRKLVVQDTVMVNMTYVPCGDVDASFDVDFRDVDYFVAWLWGGGPAPFQMRAADVDLSLQVDPLDVNYLSNYVFEEGHAPCAWTIGDVDHDFWVEEDDVDYFVEWLYQGGPAPKPLESADVDCSLQVDPLDLNYLSQYIYQSGPEPGLACYVRGDFNHVGGVNYDDVIYLRNWLWEGGPPPMPLESADVNCSGQVDALDLSDLVQYVLYGVPTPCLP